jgi:hypothetical protein
MNAHFSRTEQKPQIFASILIALTMVIVLHFSLNITAIHSISFAASFTNIQTTALSEPSSPVAVPVPTPPTTPVQIQATPAAPGHLAQVSQPIPVPAPAPSLP